MIVVDTSALMAILLKEPGWERIATLLSGDERVLISAGTLVEARIVAMGRGLQRRMEELLEESRLEIVVVDAAAADVAVASYRRYGKGFDSDAALNFGDCFAYGLAKNRELPLLFVGTDFAATDIEPALRTT